MPRNASQPERDKTTHPPHGSARSGLSSNGEEVKIGDWLLGFRRSEADELGHLITGKEMANRTAVTGFLLLGFSEVREVRLVQAAPFLPVYLAALTGNLLVVAVTALDRRLRAPMYFFLGHLSVLDLCYISVTVPQSVHNSLTDNRSISFLGCVFQLFFLLLFAFSELYFLTAMSYDRYAAICRPLRYGVIMDRGACGKMAAASWLGGTVSAATHAAATFSAGFGGSDVIRHFFCDTPQMMELSGPGGNLQEIGVTVFSAILNVSCLVSIVVSYARIFGAVLRMPAAEGRARAFSTCLPHLAVVILFISTGTVAHLKPPSASSSTPDLLVSVFYTVVPPALNPLIYSLRNRDVKAALGRLPGVRGWL
ncbi:olfactory receptor 14J1-like [Ornithorhynchus anatinus]|uniref:olfactory receptor 14J1-like n=1 Tax=Ornithorhynchus anatinus TaxID=9258 RepID=UPI0010A90BC3|nr:olfactory receptor 14J1-like [Ornithorhynchus anatinus]